MGLYIRLSGERQRAKTDSIILSLNFFSFSGWKGHVIGDL